MNFQNLKIIPLLVIVAMLAFSVRLVEFGMGVSEISGAAFAAAEKKEEKAEGEDAAPEKDPRATTVVSDGLGEDDLIVADDTPKQEMTFESEEDEMAAKKEAEMKKAEMEKAEKSNEDPDKPSIEWRDASDEEFEYSSVRKEMFDDMTKRREGLDEKERAITTREALLKAAEQELDRKYQEMKKLRDEIEGLLDKQSGEEQSRINSLVKVYEGMKPKDAARIFDTLDLDVLVAVMSRMSERKMSPVLANMNPERARTVTIMLAEEKKLPSLPGR